MDIPIVKVKNEQANSALSVDLHFDLASESRLRLLPWLEARHERTLQYLNQALIKNPKNLRWHTQKIFLLLETKAVQQLSAALIDLFIVTGAAGKKLKQQLLQLSEPLLTAEQFQFLQSNQAGQITAQTILPSLLVGEGYSLLNKGLIGSSQLLERFETQSSPSTTVMLTLHEQALSCMEYGQLEEALALLQQAHAENPQDDKVSVDLLAIYVSLGMKAEQEALLQELQVDIE